MSDKAKTVATEMMKIIYTTEEKAACDLLVTELRRAKGKHPIFPLDPIYAVNILTEEAGETAKAANDYVHHNGDKSEIKKEATHTGAVSLRVLMNFDRIKKP